GIGRDEGEGASIGGRIIGAVAALAGGAEHIIAQQLDESGHIRLGGPPDDESPPRRLQALGSEPVGPSGRPDGGLSGRGRTGRGGFVSTASRRRRARLRLIAHRPRFSPTAAAGSDSPRDPSTGGLPQGRRAKTDARRAPETLCHTLKTAPGRAASGEKYVVARVEASPEFWRPTSKDSARRVGVSSRQAAATP